MLMSQNMDANAVIYRRIVILHTGDGKQVKRLFCATVHFLMMDQ